jgi:hypothetical protein
VHIFGALQQRQGALIVAGLEHQLAGHEEFVLTLRIRRHNLQKNRLGLLDVSGFYVGLCKARESFDRVRRQLKPMLVCIERKLRASRQTRCVSK